MPADHDPVERVVGVAMTVLSAQGAAVALFADPSGGQLVVEAGGGAGALFALEFELGDGPATEAHRDGMVVLCTDIGAPDHDRWPSLSPLVAGTRSLLAAPLRVGAERLGVLLVCRATAGPWSPDEELDATLMADLAANAVLDRLGGVEAAALGPVPYQAVVHQATGMLSARLAIGLGEALARLRALAYAEERALYDVCVDVVTRVVDVEP